MKLLMQEFMEVLMQDFMKVFSASFSLIVDGNAVLYFSLFSMCRWRRSRSHSAESLLIWLSLIYTCSEGLALVHADYWLYIYMCVYIYIYIKFQVSSGWWSQPVQRTCICFQQFWEQIPPIKLHMHMKARWKQGWTNGIHTEQFTRFGQKKLTAAL